MVILVRLGYMSFDLLYDTRFGLFRFDCSGLSKISIIACSSEGTTNVIVTMLICYVLNP